MRPSQGFVGFREVSREGRKVPWSRGGMFREIVCVVGEKRVGNPFRMSRQEAGGRDKRAPPRKKTTLKA